MQNKLFLFPFFQKYKDYAASIKKKDYLNAIYSSVISISVQLLSI